MVELEAKGSVDAWRSVELSRHPDRPRPPAFVAALTTGLVELAGDRLLVDDEGLGAAVGKVGEVRALVLYCKPAQPNLGAGGLRKATRLLGLAERFGLAVITFVDVHGLHPTELPHGPMWPAVGRALQRFMDVEAPTVAVLTGEGVSGGALALSVTDRLIVLEHAYLAPSAPEAVSAILWRAPERAPDAARLTRRASADLVQMGVATAVVPEGEGAHVDPRGVIERTGEVLAAELSLARGIAAGERRERRSQRFRALGLW